MKGERERGKRKGMEQERVKGKRRGKGKGGSSELFVTILFSSSELFTVRILLFCHGASLRLSN